MHIILFKEKCDMEINGLYDDENRISVPVYASLAENIKVIDFLFEGCDDVVKKSFLLNQGDEKSRIYLLYFDGLCDSEILMEGVIKPLTYEWANQPIQAGLKDDFSCHENVHGKSTTSSCKCSLLDKIMAFEAQTVDIKEVDSFDQAVLSVMKGDTALFMEGEETILVISTKSYPLRSIPQNDIEPVLRGPRDSFVEGFRKNTALIRRRIRDPKLKIKQGILGQRSRTDYGIAYIEDLADPKLVEEVKNSIEKYDIDAIFDSGMAEQLMEDDWNSPFPKFQSTTRPDKVASALTEGRVAVIFDNSPEVIIAPVNFNMLLQAADDYYNRWPIGTFSRIIRYIAIFLSISMPGLYIAMTVYSSELLPTKLLFAIVNARYQVTFSVVTEVLIMELFFELLREAGIRLPGPLGNTIGVVGGLIVGQAAVEAGIVSTIVVIVVALTAIASFGIPNEVFASVFRLLKFFIIITSALMGFYGFIIGILAVLIHMSFLSSFGFPFLETGSVDGEDFIIKGSIKSMGKRPMWARDENRVRLKENRKG